MRKAHWGATVALVALLLPQRTPRKRPRRKAGSSLNLRIDATLPADMTVYGYPSAKDKPYLCDSTVSRDGQYWEAPQRLASPAGSAAGHGCCAAPRS